MPKQRLTIEQIFRELREADVLIGQGQSVPEASKEIEASDKTYFRWRRVHGGLRIDQAKRMRDGLAGHLEEQMMLEKISV